MRMLQDCNLTVHTYNGETAPKTVDNIRQCYFSHVHPTAGDLRLSQGHGWVELNGLSEKAISQLHRVFACYKEIGQVLIYGSRAKDDFRSGSDIDLTLWGSNLTHNLMLEPSNQIDNLLLPYKVDLSLFALLSPDVKDHIQ